MDLAEPCAVGSVCVLKANVWRCRSSNYLGPCLRLVCFVRGCVCSAAFCSPVWGDLSSSAAFAGRSLAAWGFAGVGLIPSSPGPRFRAASTGAPLGIVA